MTVASTAARQFYEEEAIKGGWSVRQLDRQISTQFYERLVGSKRKSELLAKAHVPQAQDAIDPSLLVGIGSADAEQCGGQPGRGRPVAGALPPRAHMTAPRGARGGGG